MILRVSIIHIYSDVKQILIDHLCIIFLSPEIHRIELTMIMLN